MVIQPYCTLSMWPDTMMTSSNGNIFRVTGPFCGEFTGIRWIPRRKASDAELWFFLWSAVESTIAGWWFETQLLPLWRHCNVGVVGCTQFVTSHGPMKKKCKDFYVAGQYDDIICWTFMLKSFRAMKFALVPESVTCLVTHSGSEKMDAISQTTFSNAFPWTKIFEFRLKFRRNLFLGVQISDIPALVQQSGRSPKVVALFSATNLSSNIMKLVQLLDTIQIKLNYA